MIGGAFDLARPLLMRLDAETAHSLTIRALGLLPPRQPPQDDAALAVACLGHRFPNPVGLAAGFDKHAEVYNQLAQLGFGFVEIGAVTPEPQPGNPRPRAFRLAEDDAVINRYGFNSVGVETFAARLIARPPRGLIGINLGANKTTEDKAADYVRLVRRLGRMPAFLTVNVSSPNTPGLRAMQGRAQLADLLIRVVAARDETCAAGHKTPVLVKIAPDLTEAELDDIVGVALQTSVDGMIVSNTTISRPDSLRDRQAKEAGGLSGRPLFRLSTVTLARTAQRLEGRVPLIGVGGIDSAAAALTKIEAGATLIQLYSALVYNGPSLISRIKSGLSAEVARRNQPLTAMIGARVNDIAGGNF